MHAATAVAADAASAAALSKLNGPKKAQSSHLNWNMSVGLEPSMQYNRNGKCDMPYVHTLYIVYKHDGTTADIWSRIKKNTRKNTNTHHIDIHTYTDAERIKQIGK